MSSDVINQYNAERLAEERRDKSAKVSYSGTYEREGKLVRDKYDNTGQKIGIEVLGDAPEKASDTIIVKLPDGSYKNVLRNDIPTGAVPVSEYPGLSSESQTLSMASKLGSWKALVTTGIGSDGKQIPETVLDTYMELFNKFSPDEQITKTPAPDIPWYDVLSSDRPTYIVGPKAPVAAEVPKDEGKSLDIDTAKEILKEAGGDKNKARKLAKERGYTF